MPVTNLFLYVNRKMSRRRSRVPTKSRKAAISVSAKDDYLTDDTFAVEPEDTNPIGEDGTIMRQPFATDEKGMLLQVAQGIETEHGEGFVDNSTIIDGVFSSGDPDPEAEGVPGTAISDDTDTDKYASQKTDEDVDDGDVDDGDVDDGDVDDDDYEGQDGNQDGEDSSSANLSNPSEDEKWLINDLRWDVVLVKAYLFARQKQIPLRLVISDKKDKNKFYTIPEDISYLISEVSTNWQGKYAEMIGANGDVEAKFLFDIFDLLRERFLVWMTEVDFILLIFGENERNVRLVTNVLKDGHAIISGYNAEYSEWKERLVLDYNYEKSVFMDRASVIAEMMTGLPGESLSLSNNVQEEFMQDISEGSIDGISEEGSAGDISEGSIDGISEEGSTGDISEGSIDGISEEGSTGDISEGSIDGISEESVEDDQDISEGSIEGISEEESAGDVPGRDPGDLSWNMLEAMGGEFDRNIFSTLPDVQGIKQAFTGRVTGRNKSTGLYVDDALDIFNMALPNSQIPAVKYVSAAHNVKTKIYISKSKDREPDMEHVEDILRGMNSPNAIHFVYLLPESSDIKGKSEKDRDLILADIPHEYYIGVSWSFAGPENLFIVDLTVKQVRRIGVVDLDKIGVQIAKWVIEPIRTVFPGVDISSKDDYLARLEYDLHGVKVEDARFLFYLLNTQKMYMFLHSKENPNPYAFRGNLKAIFKHPLTSMVGKVSGDYFEIYPHLSTEVSLKGFDVYSVATVDAVNTAPVSMRKVLLSKRESNPERGLTRVTLENIRKRDMLVVLSSIELVMRTYAQSVEFDKLENLFPKKVEVEEDLTKVDGRQRKRVKLESLLKQDPSLFKGGYSKKCQKIRQPKIVPESEVEVDGSYTVNINGVEYEIPKYKVAGTDSVAMDFAGNSGKKFFYACYGPGMKYTYPGLVKNPQGDEKLLPCCFLKDQRDIPEKNKPFKKAPKPYLQYKIKDEESRPKITGQETDDAYSGRLIKTQKILTEGAIGQLPPILEQFLKIAIQDKEIYRVGITISPRSFIDAMLTAVGDPVHDIPNMGDRREEKIKAISDFLASDIRYSAVVKQEAFDMSYQEISSMYRDLKASLDPEVFYRAMEELFGVNILVVSTTSKESNSYSSMVVPRNIYYHIHNLDPQRGFVIINKTWGTEALSTKDPHTELIVGFGDTTDDKTQVFDGDDADNLVSLFNDYHKVKMSVMTQEGIRTRYMENITAEEIKDSIKSLYPDNMHAPVPVSQHIDDAGKMRRLTFKIGKEYLTVGFEPKAPVLLPVSNKIYPASGDIREKLQPYEVAVSGNLNRTVFGSWHRMENGSLFMISFDEYQVRSGDVDVEWIPPAFFPQVRGKLVSISRNIDDMKLYKTKLITAVVWYYLTFYRNIPDFGIQDFMEYFELDTSLEMPDMGRFLEDVTGFEGGSDYDDSEQVRAYIESTTEGFMFDGKIFLGSRKIYNWFLDHIPRVNIQNTRMFVLGRKTSFRHIPPEDISLVEGLEQINVWKSSLHSKHAIYERFSASTKYVTQDSIIMAPVGDKMAPFISMTFNTIQDAIFAADWWRREKQVPSREVVSAGATRELLSLPRVVYALTDTREVVFVKNHTNGDPDYLYILYTGNSQGLQAGISRQHAALLPLF